MKRILQIVGSLEVGGLQAVAMNCMRYSDRKHFHFDFLVCSESVGCYEEEAKKCGCSVFHLADGISHLRFYREVKKIIKMNGPYDVVYSHIFMNSGLALLAAKMCGVKKCVAHAHSIQRSDGKEIKRRLYYSLMRVFLTMFADVKIACSEAAGRYVFGSNSSFTVINNGIDFAEFQFDPKTRATVRERLGVSSCFIIGTVGRLSYPKNQKFLIDVFSRVKRYCEDAKLLIVGDGELREDLTNHVKKSGIENSVIFIGSVSNVPDYLSAMDVFVLPSLHEGFAISELEAQANGLITICSDSIPKDVKLTEWITFLPLSKGVDAWAEEILRLYKNGGSGHKAAIGNNALREYDINKCVDRLISLLD